MWLYLTKRLKMKHSVMIIFMSKTTRDLAAVSLIVMSNPCRNNCSWWLFRCPVFLSLKSFDNVQVFAEHLYQGSSIFLEGQTILMSESYGPEVQPTSDQPRY